jgi:hypothetical protein
MIACVERSGAEADNRLPGLEPDNRNQRLRRPKDKRKMTEMLEAQRTSQDGKVGEAANSAESFAS